jgi:hypothetical protein
MKGKPVSQKVMNRRIQISLSKRRAEKTFPPRICVFRKNIHDYLLCVCRQIKGIGSRDEYFLMLLIINLTLMHMLSNEHMDHRN